MSEPTPPTPSAIAAKLAAPFPAAAVGWKPKQKEPDAQGRILAVAYLVGHVIEERLDEVLGPDGWEDAYQPIADGCVLCTLAVRFIACTRVVRQGIGAPSKQDDAGDRLKAAETQSLKRAAVKLGIGRYVARLPRLYLAYDKTKKRLTETPSLPAWALPGGSGKPPNRSPQQHHSANLRIDLVRNLDRCADAKDLDVLALAVRFARCNELLLERDDAQVVAAGERARARLGQKGPAK
jgi:hypothetical protein